MKKKLALLLAATMALSAVPSMGLFAANTSSFKYYSNLPKKTMTIQDLSSSKTVTNDELEVEYITPSRNLSTIVGAGGTNDQIKADDIIRFTFNDKTEWFFAEGTEIKNTIDSEGTRKSTFLMYDASSVAATTNQDAIAAFKKAIDATFVDIAAFNVIAVPTAADKAAFVALLGEVNAAVATVDAALSATAKADVAIKAYIDQVKLAVKDAEDELPAIEVDLKAELDAAKLAAVDGKILVTAVLETGATNAAKVEDGNLPAIPGTNSGLTFRIKEDDSSTWADEGSYREFNFLTAYYDETPIYEIRVTSNNKQEAIVKIIKPLLNEKDELILPLIFRSLADAESIIIKPTVGTSSVTVNTATANAGTNTSVKAIENGRDSIDIGDISIAETSAGVIKTGGFTTLTIGDDFEWSITKDFKMVYNFPFEGAPSGTFYWLNKDRTELTIKFAGLTNSDKDERGTVVLKGLKVVPNDDAIDTGYYGQNVTMKIKEVSSYEDTNGNTVTTDGTTAITKSGVKEQSGIVIGKFVDYGVSLTFDAGSSAKVTESYSGRKEIKAGTKGDDVAKIKFAENTTRSWWAIRALKLHLTDADGKVLDGVKFRSFEVTDTSNVDLGDGNKQMTEKDTAGAVKFDFDEITITGKSEIDPTKLGSMKFEVDFNAAADFVGDVYLSVSGNAFGDSAQNEMKLKIATVSAPLKVTAKTTGVAIGYQSYAVADITVTENAAGVLKKNEPISFAIREFAGLKNVLGSDIAFNPITDQTFKITAGDLAFDRTRITSGSVIEADIKKESKEATTFTLNTLKVSINRSVPYGHWDLVVGGKAWVETYVGKDFAGDVDKTALFDVEGMYVKDYINVLTDPSTAVVSKNVVVRVGTNTALVDGVEVDMGISTYIDPASNRTMLPLRAVSLLFGIPDNNVIWDPKTGTAVIVIGDKMISFVNGSTDMTINGVSVAMVDEFGVEVKATINPENDRMYIPLRQLGLGYGVDVLWIDGTPGLAIFNPTAEQKEEANTTSSSTEEATEEAAEATDETATDEKAAE